jgi:hypothetical protein
MQKIRTICRILSSGLFLFVCLLGTSGVRARAQQKPLTADEVLLLQRIRLEEELSVLKVKYSELHPSVRAKQQELDALNDAVKKKER